MKELAAKFNHCLCSRPSLFSLFRPNVAAPRFFIERNFNNSRLALLDLQPKSLSL